MRKTNYDKHKKDSNSFKEYEIGTRVLWNINSHYNGNKKKLGPHWVGPYEIVALSNDFQSIRIRSIPLANNQLNPMNFVKIPKRAPKTKENS